MNPPLNVTRIERADQFYILISFFERVKAEHGGILGFDVETNPLKDWFHRRCRTVQFGNVHEQYVVDLLALCDNDPDLLYAIQGNYGKELYRAPAALHTFLDIIRPILCGREYTKAGVSLSFEYLTFYWLFGIRTQKFFDCALMEKVIWAGGHSLKDYGFYSMEEMMGRYFGIQIDKSLQESFRLEGALTDEQVVYAALDTRFPLPLRTIQNLILDGHTSKSLLAKGHSVGHQLARIENLLLLKAGTSMLTGDILTEIGEIENDAIGAFQDMHIHGERIDRERWRARVAICIEKRTKLISDVLDPIFIPIVGDKNHITSEADLEEAKARWKFHNNVTPAEVELKQAIRKAKRSGDLLQYEYLVSQLESIGASRKEEKERAKDICMTMQKQRTVAKNLASKCEGNALINYGSDKQLLRVLITMHGLKRLSNLEDETLEKYERYPVMAAIRDLHGLNKDIGTYGYQWAMEWVTKPCKEEGWLHPGDGRLHCVFNQYDAETGRSSSEKPNGQNLPQDKEVRSCFIADAPDESIRISDCCEAEAHYNKWEGEPNAGKDAPVPVCSNCGNGCLTHAEEYVIVTADMSGAELRIIADDANDPTWIGAFARREDVHAVGTELLYELEWLQGTLEDCAYFKLHTDETVAANPKCTVGDPMRQKCNCPEHKERRDDNKATNFLLAYGGEENTLAARIKKAVSVARELMERHRIKNPRIWEYLDELGRRAKITHKAFDMFGRRRLFPEPTWQRAEEKVIRDKEEKLRIDEDDADQNVANFIAQYNRKPDKQELYFLTHRKPTQKEIARAFYSLGGSIERQGKNHPIQGTNATIAKKAMGAGYCPAGKPYLWHTLPQYKAKLVKFVHDELVVHCPKRYGKQVAGLIGDAFKRAAAEKMKKVIMEFEFNIASYWKK